MITNRRFAPILLVATALLVLQCSPSGGGGGGSVPPPASTVSTYSYDADGSRVTLSVGTTTTLYLSAFYNVTGTKTTRHVVVNGHAIATIESGPQGSQTFWNHTDHLGSTRVVTDESGAVVESIDYKPFGAQVGLVASGHTEQRKFTGHERDEPTGYTYAIARYLDTNSGRFLSEDPSLTTDANRFKDDPQQAQSYAYARDNPLSYIDTDGNAAYAIAKPVGRNSLGTHVAIVLKPDNPADFPNTRYSILEGGYWIIGGYADESEATLIKQTNAQLDVFAYESNRLKAIEEIQRPDGVSDTAFIRRLQAAYDAYADDAQYDPFARRGYSSNNLATSWILAAGGRLPFEGNAPGIDPGYGTSLPSAYLRSDGQSHVPQTRSAGLSALSGYGTQYSLQQIISSLQKLVNDLRVFTDRLTAGVSG